MSQLAIALKRFNTLYPRLQKRQQSKITLQENIRLCKTLAKTEALTLVEVSVALLHSVQVTEQLNQGLHASLAMIMQREDYQLNESDLFTIFFYAQLQNLSKTPHVGLLGLSIDLLRKAQSYIQSRNTQINQQQKQTEVVDGSSEQQEELSLTLNQDISLKSDIKLQTILEVIAQLVNKIVKQGEEPMLQLIQNVIHQLSQYLATQKDSFFKLEQFAPTSLVYKLVEFTFKSKYFTLTNKVLLLLDQLLSQTFQLFDVYKRNSQYFIITVASSSKYEEDRQVRRMSVLFTDLLELLVIFSCLYLKALAKHGVNQSDYIQQAVRLYNTLFADSTASAQTEEQQQEYFTLRERLKILSDLNSIFNQINEIVAQKYYWNMIREGLVDQDNYCRKVSLAVLKNNLQTLGNEQLFGGFISKQEFELLWTTFFDLYDTLESFGCHLTKAVWERTEVLYAYIAKHYQPGREFHPLLDFKEWLLVVYKRVQSHVNLKLRRYVQKSTLKRKYMTVFMGDFIFDEFLRSLNKGLIFKDSNVYTQFSLNNELVNQFYERYFANESVDVAGDLRAFFRGFVKNVTHPQLLLCSMRNLSRFYKGKSGNPQGYITNDELTMIYDIINSFFIEQQFSNRYLSFKYILQMLAQYLDTTKIGELNYSLLFKIISKMPIEFFTQMTIYNDVEAQKYSIQLIECLGVQNIQEVIRVYLKDIFQVKAQVTQMPKFGTDIDSIIFGMSKVLLIMGQTYQESQFQWFNQIMKDNWEAFDQILNSSYLSNEVLDSKVRYTTVLFKTMYRYSDDRHRHALRQEFLPHIHLVLDRFENCLLVPLSKYDLIKDQPSEKGKIQSLFSELENYLEFIGLSIKMVHIHLNQSNSALEKTIKLVLQLVLKVSSEQKQLSGWGPFLLQYVVYKCLRQTAKCYSKGIKECLKKGISYFLVPEDMFVFGKPLLHNIVDFQQIPRPKDDDLEQSRFLVDNNLTISLMHQNVLLNQWKILGEFIQIFQYEQQIKQELHLLYPVIAEKAADFLGSSTPKYNNSLFRILKFTYIPLFIQKLTNNLGEATELIEEYQAICYQIWGIIKDLQTEFTANTLQEFLEFSFNPDVMEIYSRLNLNSEDVESFHHKLAKELMDYGNRYWLIMRSAFNHLMLIFAQRPHLMKSFEVFVMNFAICREIRNLDSDIQLYRLEHIIPQIIPKPNEDLHFEEITYQGAYIRTMTMIIIEELIKSHKAYLLSGQPITQQIIDFTESLETLTRLLIDINLQEKYSKADMPYSEKHRIKVRVWQTLIVMQELLDPQLYTTEFRHLRKTQHGVSDIITDINKSLWKIIGMNHLTTVRQYIEVFVIKFVLSYPALTIEDPQFIKVLLDPNTKAQVASSFIAIAGFILVKPLNVPNAIQLKQKIFDNLVGFLSSNSAHVRCVAQYFIYTAFKDPVFGPTINKGIYPVLEFLGKNKDVQHIVKKYGLEINQMDQVLSALKGVQIVLSTKIDLYGEFLSVPFVDKIKEVTSEVITFIRNQDEQPTKREDMWKKELERRKAEGEYVHNINEESTQNYQRKILPWEHVEYDHELLSRVYDNRKRNEVIICASLIDKVPNLAGLARTSEIMNASCLVINSRAVVELDEFKGVSVTSEKWLPIIEVQEKDLYHYLEFQKSNGYKILGLEQTANSKLLNEYEFPSKCILLLGKEKEGIPQEYLSVLDQCIEIPQFGIIRSLNVHVSGALCLWEYTKQHLPRKGNQR